MILLSLLISASFEFGLSFPAGNLGKEVNIGKYLNISQRIASYRGVNISPFVEFSSYPAITNPMSVYCSSVGVRFATTSKVWGFSGKLGVAVGMMDYSKNALNVDVLPSIEKAISSSLPLYVVFSVPIMFFKNVTLYTVNTGILFSL